MKSEEHIHKQLAFLYGEEVAQALLPRVHALLDQFHPQVTPRAAPLSERDAILITYGGSFQHPEEPPLRTMEAFLDQEAQGLLTGVHILPFYPYSSDDGFSVIDYRAVDPRLGSWEDILRLGMRYRLMFDAVINHISSQSDWFQGFLHSRAPYTGYFITPAPDWDLSRVIRPRTLPLLTEMETKDGTRKVWTTFSPDQIDLNYANLDVLLEMLSVLLYYVERGAQIIRLDAIAYLWKQPGTTCLHLPQTHAVVKLMRAVLDAVAERYGLPDVLLMTETNVPHAENISYFGDIDPRSRRTDEAQLVYQFPLAPLVLHTFLTGNAGSLAAWVKGLDAGSPGLFFNFLASHDGIGLSPAKGYLSEIEIDTLVQHTLDCGGRVSYRANPDGTHSPYELNITYYDALHEPGSPADLNERRFLASQAIMLSMAGVPGIYVHSLFGSRNWLEGVQQTGQARTINRASFNYPALQSRLRDPALPEARIFTAYLDLLRARSQTPAFHPQAAQRILDINQAVFALERVSLDGKACALCLVNVTRDRQTVQVAPSCRAPAWRDLLDTDRPTLGGDGSILSLDLDPYQVVWLTNAYL